MYKNLKRKNGSSSTSSKSHQISEDAKDIIQNQLVGNLFHSLIKIL